tara:strand:- start:1254 stop:1601 length:348 start_codon:yes stop_codon:yes gene_type:complete
MDQSVKYMDKLMIKGFTQVTPFDFEMIDGLKDNFFPVQQTLMAGDSGNIQCFVQISEGPPLGHAHHRSYVLLEMSLESYNRLPVYDTITQKSQQGKRGRPSGRRKQKTTEDVTGR